jgi:long-chain acyl-CoA synthetase
MRAISVNDSKNEKCKSVIETLFSNAERLPDKIAVIAGGKQVSYLQLKKLIIGASDYLTKIGIKPGDKVIVKALPSISFIAAIFGISLCRAIMMPLEKTIPEAGVNEIAEKLDVKLSITNYETDKSDNLLLDKLMEYAEEFANSGKADNYKAIFPDVDKVSAIIFTTGTTGKSKGVVLTYRNNLAAAQNTMGTTGMCEDDINVVPAPLNHTYGFRRTMGSLYIGATIVLLNGVTSARTFFNSLEELKGTTLTLVPSAMEYILRVSGDLISKYKDQLTYIEVGAEPVSGDLKKRLLKLLPKTNICNTYGSSEAGCVIGINYRTHPGKIDSIGCDAVNAEIYFTDEKHRMIEADNPKNSGFLTIKGPMVMVGYENEPELTATVLKDGILYTNDIGYRDSDGFIFLLGRKGDVINVGGNKVSPSEIEEVANRCPIVLECACVPCKDPNGILNQVPKLFVVVNKDEEFSESELKKYLAAQLEPYKVPLVYETIDELPRTFNLKIQRNKLR